MRQTFIALICALALNTGIAQVKPAGIFGDHMVLQRQKPIKIWGTSSPGEKIAIAFNGASGLYTFQYTRP